MKKSLAFIVISALAILSLAVPARAAAMTARLEDKTSPKSYKAIFFIGDMPFEGKLRRMDELKDEDRKKAEQEALKEMNLTALDIREAQLLVERVSREEKLTPEEVREVWDNILEIAGADKIADAIRVLLGDPDSTPEELAASLATDAARDKLVETLLEETGMELGEEAGGAALKILDALMITMDQYGKDQEKWKNRADAAKARQLLQKYRDLVNEKAKKYTGVQDWALDIQQAQTRMFPFMGVEGNFENWQVEIHLEKRDSDPDSGPAGTYTGKVFIKAEYDMAAWDKGFHDIYLKAMDPVIKGLTEEGGLTYTSNDDYQSTQMSRALYAKNNQQVSLPIQLPAAAGAFEVPLDLSGLTDEILMNFSHTVTDTVSDEDITLTWDSPYESTDNQPPDGMWLMDTPYGPAAIEIPWDTSIWKQWEKEKALVIYVQ